MALCKGNWSCQDPFSTSMIVGEKGTPPKTNISSENRPSQKENSLPTIDFQVQAMLLSLNQMFFHNQILASPP